MLGRHLVVAGDEHPVLIVAVVSGKAAQQVLILDTEGEVQLACP